MDCTSLLPNNDRCPHPATHILALPMLSGRCVYVAPYCNDHAADIEGEQRGVPAAGPALSEEAAQIEGIRRG